MESIMLTYENQVAKASCNHAFVRSSDIVQPAINCLQSEEDKKEPNGLERWA